jgi:G3E family GTPase
MADYATLLPVNLVTGFLGSGKTTLLNRLLRAPQLARTAVLVNEFGEVGLDHLLL